MTTYINQGNGRRLKIESIETPNGTEVGISQKTSDAVDDFLVGPNYAEIRVSVGRLSEFIEALVNERNYLQRSTVGTNPTQGQLFDPDTLEVE